jgi:MFS family permease
VTEEPASLWRNTSFTIFWTVQSISVVGNTFSFVAMPLLVLEATGSLVQMGLLTAVASVVSVVFGPFAGVLVDQMSRRMLMVVSNLARAVLFGLIPLVWWLSGPQIWLLYAVTASTSGFGILFHVAYVTAVPNLVAKSQITQANGRLEATYAVAYVVGPMLAGTVSGLFGTVTAVAVDAVSFVMCVVGLLFVRWRPKASAGDPEPAVESTKDKFLVGVRFLWRQPVMRALTVLLTLFTFLTLGLTDVFIYHVRNGQGNGDQAVGFVLGAASVGAIAGALIASSVRKRLGFGACWLGSILLCALSIGFFGLTTNVAAATVVAMVFSFGQSVAGVCSMSLRQEVTPDHMLGRVTSAFWTIHSALGPVGAAVVTAMAANIGVTQTCVLVGGLCLMTVVGGLFTPVRQRDPETNYAEGESVGVAVGR